jgi:hypothetical protein
VERGELVGSGLHRALRDLVKMSAWKKKLLGFVLGVVIVKESMLSSVALIKIVEQVVLEVLGSENLVTP